MIHDDNYTKLWKEVNGIICYEEFEIVPHNNPDMTTDTYDLKYTVTQDINRIVNLVVAVSYEWVHVHYDHEITNAKHKGWKEVPYLNKDDTDKNTKKTEVIP